MCCVRWVYSKNLKIDIKGRKSRSITSNFHSNDDLYMIYSMMISRYQDQKKAVVLKSIKQLTNVGEFHLSNI